MRLAQFRWFKNTSVRQSTLCRSATPLSVTLPSPDIQFSNARRNTQLLDIALQKEYALPSGGN
jgi:hypothetical protein